jgi:hypothetical protein
MESMQVSPPVPTLDHGSSEDDTGFWRSLFYRWFVEYNPLYLLSAALVLGGCFLWSRGLVHEQSLAGPLGVPFVAELYAAALVGGVALLTRIGLRRPAVMLAFLIVLYQWDITLHTETCAYLGSAGAWATALWFAIFVAKLYGLEWALHIRLSRQVAAAAIVAALGLATGPRVLATLGQPGARWAGALLAVWVFALLALHRRGGISSTAHLDAWGHTVLARATRAAWLLSGALVGAHVFFWWRDHHLPLAPVLLSVPLLFARAVRGEARMWAVLAGTLCFAAEVAPDAFFAVSLLAAATLCLRALAPAFPPSVERVRSRAGQPYRTGAGENATAAEPSSRTVTSSPDVGAAERARSFAGALFATYLAAWTLTWTSGPWPAHVLALDLALTVGIAVAVGRTRVRSAILPLAASYGHFALASHLVPIPRSSVAWGESAVALGFAMLGGALFASYSLRARTASTGPMPDGAPRPDG